MHSIGAYMCACASGRFSIIRSVAALGMLAHVRWAVRLWFGRSLALTDLRREQVQHEGSSKSDRDRKSNN